LLLEAEIENAFRASVDDCLDFCRELGEAPDSPFTGRFMLRLPPKLHRKAYVNAALEGKASANGSLINSILLVD